jgi:hypothetical protein
MVLILSGIYRGNLVKPEMEVEEASQTDLSILSKDDVDQRTATAAEETQIVQLETSEELKREQVVEGKENIEPVKEEKKPPVYKPQNQKSAEKLTPVARVRSSIALPEEKFNIVEILESGGTMR